MHLGEGAAPSTAAAIFTALWGAIADVLGGAAAATLVRRAVKRTREAHPELDQLVVAKVGLEYTYFVPPTWNAAGITAPASLQAVSLELCRTLDAMTGPLMLQRLSAIPELQGHGLFSNEERT